MEEKQNKKRFENLVTLLCIASTAPIILYCVFMISVVLILLFGGPLAVNAPLPSNEPIKKTEFDKVLEKYTTKTQPEL